MKRISIKDTVGPCEPADQTTAAKKTKPPTHDDPQIPQPDLRFVRERGKQTKHQTKHKPTGPEPKKKHPRDQSAKGHSGLTTASLSKTCDLNCDHDMEAWPASLSAHIEMLTSVNEHDLQIDATGSSRRIDVRRKVVAVSMSGTPLRGRAGMTHGRHHSPVKQSSQLLFFRPTPPRLSPGRYTSFNLPEIELICMQSHQKRRLQKRAGVDLKNKAPSCHSKLPLASTDLFHP